MDVKLGLSYHTMRHNCMQVRRRQVKCLATSMAELSFRIYGMRVYKPFLDSYYVRNSHDYYRLLNLDDGSLVQALMTFLPAEEGQNCRHVALRISQKIEALAKVLIASSDLAVSWLSSSVLIIYEGAPNLPMKIAVKLIDFDKTIFETDPTTFDATGICNGLVNLCKLFRMIAKKNNQRNSMMLPPPVHKKNVADNLEPRPRSKSDPMRNCSRDRVRGRASPHDGKNRLLKNFRKALPYL